MKTSTFPKRKSKRFLMKSMGKHLKNLLYLSSTKKINLCLDKYISKEEIKEMFNEVCGETITGHPNRETMVEMSRRYAEESEQKEEFNLDVLKEKIKQRKVFIKNYLKKWTND